MMTVERIWGKKAIEELSKPHPDPGIRKMEEELEEIATKFYNEEFLSTIRRNVINYDLLPECYKKVKV